jgi:hypothetical protein
MAKLEDEGLNLTFNPVVSALELTPWSFVADWFLSLGDILRMAVARSLAKETSYAMSYKLVRVLNAYAEPDSAGYDAAVKASGTYWSGGTYTCTGTADSTEVIRIRVPCSAPSVLPHLRFDLDVAKVLDLVALLLKPIAKVARL